MWAFVAQGSHDHIDECEWKDDEKRDEIGVEFLN
jgi:hypothetical protein